MQLEMLLFKNLFEILLRNEKNRWCHIPACHMLVIALLKFFGAKLKSFLQTDEQNITSTL